MGSNLSNRVSLNQTLEESLEMIQNRNFNKRTLEDEVFSQLVYNSNETVEESFEIIHHRDFNRELLKDEVYSELIYNSTKAARELMWIINKSANFQMSMNGTVHELTINVLKFLEQLQTFDENLKNILLERHVPFYPSDEERLLFPKSILKILHALDATLEAKSKHYSDVHLGAIFMMNNIHYVQKQLQCSGLLDISLLYNPTIETYFDDQIRNQKRIYSQSWSRLLHYALEVNKPSLPANFKLQVKDKLKIKDNFNGFNKELEEITRKQGVYAIPDTKLRESLKSDNKEFIIPKYTMLYEKYINVHFTMHSNNVKKYIKYTPHDVSNVLDTFFVGS